MKALRIVEFKDTIGHIPNKIDVFEEKRWEESNATARYFELKEI